MHLSDIQNMMISIPVRSNCTPTLDMMDLNGHNSALPLDEKSTTSGTLTGLDRILRKSKYKLKTYITIYSNPCINGGHIEQQIQIKQPIQGVQERQ